MLNQVGLRHPQYADMLVILPTFCQSDIDTFRNDAALAGQTFLSINQNQRGALTLLNDTVYVPYGGPFGLLHPLANWELRLQSQHLPTRDIVAHTRETSLRRA